MISIDISKQCVYYKPSTSLAGPDLNAPVEKKFQSKNFNDFSDKYFYEKSLENSQYNIYIKDWKDVVNDVSRCVGAIIAIKVDDSTDVQFAGTCFRIGTKYVITNLHVLEDISNNGYKIDHVDFNYNQGKSWPCKFDELPVLVHGIDSLDYAILTLQVDTLLPPSIADVGFSIATHFQCFNGEECLTLVGYPGGNLMIDPSCPIEPPTEDPSSYFYNRRNNKKGSIQYHPKTFFAGSSGSPGLLIRQKKVASLHCRGVKEDDFWFGEGIMLFCVKEDVRTRIENKSLQGVTLDDIFELKFGIQEYECSPLSDNCAVEGEMNFCLQDSDEPMDLDSDI